MSEERELPQPLDLLWGEQTKRARRPRAPRLSAPRVVESAVALADADGLAAVSMERLAKHLRVATMSLYRHVRTKDELLLLMVEAALGESPAADDVSTRGWRARLERWAADLLQIVDIHRWVPELPLARMSIGPARAAWLDRGLAALAGTSLAEDEKTTLVLLLNDYVFSHARFDAQLADDSVRGRTPLLPPVIDAERYPALRRALDAGALVGAAHDRRADFEFGLARILDGVDQLLRERASP